MYKVFKCIKDYYVYDSNINCVAKIDNIIYDILKTTDGTYYEFSNISDTITESHSKDDLASAFSEIQKYKNEKGMFCQTQKCKILTHNVDLLDRLNRNLDTLQLNVTEDCNLRCKYCTFDNSADFPYRKHSNKYMEFNTARMSVDYFMKHSSNTNLVTITFYGGEPLLCMDLIKKVYQHVNQSYPDRLVKYYITSNGTLLNEDIASILNELEIDLSISFDGPCHIHDQYRVNKEGKGSHELITRNLRYMKKEYPDYYKEHVSFQATHNPSTDIETVIEYFLSDDLFTDKTTVSINKLSLPDSGFDFNTDALQANTTKLESYWHEILEKIASHTNPINDRRMATLEQLFIPDIMRVYKALGRECSANTVYPNGCCIPGVSRLFVSTEGSFYYCESANHLGVCIGNYIEGISINAVTRIINEYNTKSEADCNKCWLIHICGLCYLSAYDSSKHFNLGMKRYHCTLQREQMLVALQRMLQVLQINKEYLNTRLNSIQFSE